MPSKRTNDSVDRILEDLNIQQAQAGLRDSVTDRQVDEILRSVGITSAPAQPVPDRSPAPGADGGLDALLQQPAAAVQPAPRTARPTQPAPYTPARQPVQPVQSTRPPQQTMPTPAAAENTTGSLGYDGDTTRTGIIKDFLLKMAPDGSAANTDALNQGKNQFQKFFKNSVAVVPDEKGRMPKPEKKKRGFLGLKHAEDTGAFVPINVSLSGKNAEYEDDPAMQQEYYPDQEPEQPPQRSAEPRRKQGFLGGFFAPEEETEELMIPEERAEEPARSAPAPQPVCPAEPETDREDPTQEVWRSKYTRPARRGAEEQGGQTMDFIRNTVDQAQKHPSDTLTGGMTGTIYRKKRNTVEFTPGKKPQTAPPPQPVPQRSGEPVGEPIEVPRSQPVPSGFTMQIGGLDTVPTDSTQEFMSAYNAVRPRRRQAAAQPRPTPRPAAQNPAPQPDAAGEDPYENTVVVGDATQEENRQTGELLLPHRQRDDVDQLVDTLTGRISLTPQPPAAPAHTGFTQSLSAPAPAHSGFTQNLSSVAAAPARTGFTQQLGGAPAPAQSAHSGYTQNLGAAPAEPNTSAFVSDIANAINSGEPAGDTLRYEDAAARLTASLAEDAAAARTHTHIPTAAEVRQAAARFAGRAEDESEDNAVSPFETAEIPVPHSREYERAEDAPAVRAELAKKLTQATVACLVSGVAAAVMIVLAVLPVRPAALGDAMVYPAVMLVLLLAACAANWEAFLSGIRGLVKIPSPDSLSILPAIGAALQCILMLANGGYTANLPMLAGPAALVLCLNAAGRRLNAATVSDNFQLVSAKVEHAVAYRLKDAGALRAVSQGLAEPHPSVLVSRPTQIFRSFLANSAARGTSDKNQQQFAWLLGGCCLAAFLFTVIRSKDPVLAATVMAGVGCLAAPLAGTLLSALPARMMQRSAAQVGAVIPGWRDIRQLGRINVIQVTARDLFPVGCVSLAGIKPVKPEHIDTAIVYAASILSEAGPTLRDVFMNMLGENRSLLAKVDDRQTIYGKGYVGWINKRRVLVGNRAPMQEYGIKIPSLEYEQHHTVNQRRVIYLAVSGKLFAMFQVAYQRDPDTAAVLETLHHAGLSLVVDCDDFNCDVRLLETAYSLPAGSVKVLTSGEHQAVAPAVAWLPESEGNMLHLGSFASFVGGLQAAAGAAEGEHKAAIVLTVSVLFSCAVGVLLTLTGGLVTLPLAGIVLYQAAWCVLALVFPLMQHYY
ncbi:MAG: hypothetical protein UF620_02820 [Gemmiger sp.]|uniref:hypothetical protein n=1 Tax=Gemmiger sp. TaxID=2049027 RepID=UPI002E77A546|nr:hypothetical protein [Gemmiger sp.]MEE1422318.1 hypothetical protein [Gemmiger sp.]